MNTFFHKVVGPTISQIFIMVIISMSSPNCDLRFSIVVLETLKFEWQCSQYLELNPTCEPCLPRYINEAFCGINWISESNNRVLPICEFSVI